MNKISIKEIKDKYQYSSSDTIYARIVCRKFSVYFTWFFLYTSIIPNQLTVLMILLGITGGIFLGLDSYISGLIGSLFLQLFLIFDCVDGEIARCKKIFSSKGKFLDFIANDIIFVSIFSGLIFRIFNGNYEIFYFQLFHNPIVVILGFSTIVFSTLFKLSSNYAKEIDDRMSGNFLKSSRSNIKIKPIIFQITGNLSSPPTIIIILTVCAIFDIFQYILFFYGTFSPLYYFTSLIIRLKSKEIK